MKIKLLILLFSLQVNASSQTVATNTSAGSEVKTVTADGITLFGQKYFGSLDNQAPLILLFHQAGSNGRGEYKALIPWLNNSGFRTIAWDLRSGKARFDFENRTVNAFTEEVKYSYCEVSPDLQAALDYVLTEKLADEVVVWGSSYSAALVFKLAADNKQTVSGVAAFSPASGGPMEDCRARMWLDDVSQPVVVFRPEKEMDLDSSKEQRDIFMAAGASFHVIKNGVHGSSMLDDSRTKNNMKETRMIVEKWIKSL